MLTLPAPLYTTQTYYSADGVDLPALDPGIPFHRIRSEEVIVGADDDPWLAGADAGEAAGPGERLW